MLVLTRKDGESVIVGSPDDIKGPIIVKVLGIRAGRVKLGFQVADSVTVDRWEVWKQRRSSGQLNRLHTPSTLKTSEQMEQWEDDGGGVDYPT